MNVVWQWQCTLSDIEIEYTVHTLFLVCTCLNLSNWRLPFCAFFLLFLFYYSRFSFACCVRICIAQPWGLLKRKQQRFTCFRLSTVFFGLSTDFIEATHNDLWALFAFSAALEAPSV